MDQANKKTVINLLFYIPIWLCWQLGHLMPFRLRSSLFAGVGGFLVPLIPETRNRILNGLKLIYPEMGEQDAKALCKNIGKNTGRTVAEIFFNSSYKNRLDLFDVKGAGLEALREAKSEGKGAIIVSAHFGQWEAIRHYLKSQNMETGAVYRENSNPWFELRWLAGIKHGGEPIVAKSPGGSMKMVKHLRKGGFFALLVDQKFQHGQLIPFLGHEALTATAAAELALRYNLPLVPAFGTRDDNGLNIHVEFETPIEHSDALAMMREVNDRIGARISAKPEQWYWLHKRWEDTHLFEVLQKRKSG